MPSRLASISIKVTAAIATIVDEVTWLRGMKTDVFNHGPAELVLLLPITTKDKRIPLHVPVSPAESGLRERSFVKCEDLRSVSRDRLTRRLGAVGPDTLAEVEDRLRILLEL